MPYRSVSRLVEIFGIRTYEAGESVLGENEVCDGLYLVLSGRLAIPQDDSVLNERALSWRTLLRYITSPQTHGGRYRENVRAS